MRDVLCRLLRVTGLPLFIRSVIQRRRVTVLLYHDIDARTAEQHFAALRKLYSPISLQTYLHLRQTNDLSKLPPRPLIVTFDDGHASVYGLKPALLKHRMPITVFLCSGLVGTTRQFWFTVPGLDDAKRQHLKTLPDEARLASLQSLGFDPTAETGRAESLTVSEVSDLKDLVDFQSHTVSHPILPACSEEKARAEISLSRKQLEDDLHIGVNALAYPNGSYTLREVHMARHAGYECGLTTKPGFNTGRTPLFELKRLTIRDDCSIDELIVRACGLWALLRMAARMAGTLPRRLLVPASPVRELN
jgi:peptidoglycan/xylan/chitin deacetylase (PgdA/CDA1 family)